MHLHLSAFRSSDLIRHDYLLIVVSASDLISLAARGEFKREAEVADITARLSALQKYFDHVKAQ